jgi:UDP-N-acetyl-D-mannosaminuronic acid transferase (WecB/TagA/CpsF family)
MTAFKDLGITAKPNSFVGDKIKLDKIINQEITVHAFKIDKSTKKENSDYLTIQFERNETKYVVFTGSKILMQMINEVPADKFPFKTTIVKNNDYPEFT